MSEFANQSELEAHILGLDVQEWARKHGDLEYELQKLGAVKAFVISELHDAYNPDKKDWVQEDFYYGLGESGSWRRKGAELQIGKWNGKEYTWYDQNTKNGWMYYIRDRCLGAWGVDQTVRNWKRV